MVDKFISIIVPCYNEEVAINETHNVLYRIMYDSYDNFEILYINDGSSDKTLIELLKIREKSNNVRVINFSRNFGHQAAVSAGISLAKGDYAVIIDADLQDPPSCIPLMVKQAIDEQANVVYGVRKIRKGESLFKKITAKLFYRILNYFSEIQIPVDTGDFRLIDRKVINQFNQLKEKQKYIRGLITWIGYKQIPFYYEREARVAGETHYPFFKMVSFAVKGLMYFSKKPLSLATNLGVISVGISLLFLLYFLIQKVFFPQTLIQGWTSIICLIVFFGGIQLLTIGLLGSYIGNMFAEIKDRPEYIIDEII